MGRAKLNETEPYELSTLRQSISFEDSDMRGESFHTQNIYSWSRYTHGCLIKGILNFIG